MPYLVTIKNENTGLEVNKQVVSDAVYQEILAALQGKDI